MTVGIFSISTRSSNFLEFSGFRIRSFYLNVILYTLWNIEVNNCSNVSFVETHSKGNSSNDDFEFIAHK